MEFVDGALSMLNVEKLPDRGKILITKECFKPPFCYEGEIAKALIKFFGKGVNI